MALAKRPRYVIELAFDSHNTILWYLTSHDDSALPGGALSILGVIEGISGTSQTLNPDTANASIGNINFTVVDKASIVTTTLGSQLVLGRSTRRQRVRVYIGFEGMAWADYTLVQTQLVNEISYNEGAYKFTCADVQREMRKDIFELAKTTLAQSLSASATTIEVFNTSAFQMLAHGASYSDAPNALVGYVKIQDEVIRYTDKTPTQFILGAGGQRGALNTRAVEHAVDLAASADRRTSVEEYVYLEMPALKLMYALLTGVVQAPALSLPGVSGSYASTPDSAANSLTGTIEIETCVLPDSYTDGIARSVLMKRAVNNQSYGMRLSGNSFLSPSGSIPIHSLEAGASNVVGSGVSLDMLTSEYAAPPFDVFGSGVDFPLPSTQGKQIFLKSTIESNVGGGVGRRVIHYYKHNIRDSWTQLGVVRTNAAITATPFDGNAPVEIGSDFLGLGASRMFKGKILYGLLRNGIGGPVVLKFDPVESHGNSSWTSSTGEVWTVNGSGFVSYAPLATLPDSWHLGIDLSYVRLDDFVNKTDLWNPVDDIQGFNVRFEGLTKTDGKKFIESELALLAGVFMPVYSDGALGLKRMTNMLAGSSYVKLLDNSNLVNVGDLIHDFDALRNVLQISWNWEPVQKDFTRVNLLVDAGSITVHGKADPLKLKFRGLHGSIHSSTILAQRFDSIRDRYTGPPQRIGVDLVPSLNILEVGDVVRLKPAGVRDFVVPGGGALDRSFEIQNISIDWISGKLSTKLFGSSQAPGAMAATSDATVLSDAWYTSQGTILSSVLTITGSNPGHVTANGTLTGAANLTASASIFYYAGDLVIDPGVTVNLVNNVQLRVRGFFQNNGTINGKGNGLVGAAAVVTPINDFHYNAGISGFIGTTEAGGGVISQPIGQRPSTRGGVVLGQYPTVPSFTLTWNGIILGGLPSDLRGSSGSSGNPTSFGFGADVITRVPGGAGGDGGAGLLVVSRGFTQGAAGKIDLSGDDGLLGSVQTDEFSGYVFRAGSGAGGAPGAFVVLLDGAGTSATGITEAGFVALNGATPIGGLTPFDHLSPIIGTWYSDYVGTGDGTTFPLPSMSGSRGGNRVQYIPGGMTAEADAPAATLLPPTNIGLASGTAELLIQSDGTVVPRIKVTWTPSLDARTLAYELQFKRSTDVTWGHAPVMFGIGNNSTWVIGVSDGVLYDVRLRSAGANREVSDWSTISNYPVVGKTAVPSNVSVLTFIDPFLSWAVISDQDRRGYIVRYQPGSNTDWVSAIPAHVEGFITEARFDTGDIVGGQTTLLVKAVDTSGNQSTTAASLVVDLRPTLPTSFLLSRQPDGTREFNWSTTVLPADFEGVRIRYYLGTTSDWTAMTPLHNGVLKAAPFETNQLAAGVYTFAAKNVDRAGNESATATFITTLTLGDPRIAGSIEDLREEPGWAGTKTDCHVDAVTGWLVADGSATWTTLPATWTLWTKWNATPKSPITYVHLIDIGVKVRFLPLVTVFGDGSQTIEEQHSDDGSSYTSYAAVGPQVDARYIRIKVTLTGSYPIMKTMRIILSAQTIIEYIEDQASGSLAGSYRIGTGDVRVPITQVYTVIKKVDITLQSVGAGWSVELIDKDKTVGPRIKIYNSSNTLADATFDATVTGI